LISEKKTDKAKVHLDRLKEHCPELPQTVYLEALYWVRLERFGSAKKVLKRLKRMELVPPLSDAVIKLNSYVAVANSVRNFLQDKTNLSAADKTLTLDPTLARAMRNLPVDFIRAACVHWQLPAEGQRATIQQQLINFLSSPVSLADCWACLKDDEKDLVMHLLNKDGWARMSGISRKFGPLDEDFNYATPGSMPKGSLSRLWAMGLVSIGITTINNRKCKIVTVPIEVRELAQIIAGD
jgi:hypothetical protein